MAKCPTCGGYFARKEGTGGDNYMGYTRTYEWWWCPKCGAHHTKPVHLNGGT